MSDTGTEDLTPLAAPEGLDETTCSRCIVNGCANQRHQGRFIGDLCAPCHTYITTGRVGPTTSFLGKLDGLMDALKTISVSDWKTAGELRKMARDAYSSANKQTLEILDCPNCDNVGWYMVPDSEGRPTMEQCQWCYTVSNSRFNSLSKTIEERNVCIWRYRKGHGGEWETSCGAWYDADDFGCSTIRKCPKCGKKTTTSAQDFD